MGVWNDIHWLDFVILFVLFTVACMIAMHAEDIFQRRQRVPRRKGRHSIVEKDGVK